MRELQDPQDRAQSIEGALAEEPPDDLARRRANLRRAPHAARGRRQQPGHLRRRQVIGIGQPLASPRRAWVRRHECVLIKDPHARVGGADPEPLADQPVRRRVERVIEDDVTVGMQLRLLPRGAAHTARRQRQEHRALDRVKARERRLLRRPVDPSAGGLDTPDEHALIRLVHVPEGAARQEIPLHVVDAALLDFAFGISRALHLVMPICHKFSSSRIPSIRSMDRRLSC